MESLEIIENIDSIYERFKTPKHMQLHMKRAAAIAKLICKNWIGEGINGDDVVTVLLLHDLGNIVRMTFDNPELNSLYEEDSDIETLKKIKSEAIQKYGEDDHKATKGMCRKLGISDRVMSLMEDHAFINNRNICASSDFDLKICAYADQRVGPHRVLGLKVRLEEVAARGSNRPWYSDFEVLLDCALKIENQVLEKNNLSKEEIDDDSIAPYLEHINS